MTSIQAVTFDVGGTLIEPWPSVGHVYAEVAAKHGFPDCPVEVLNRQFAAAWRGRKAFDYSEAAWAVLVDRSFAGVIEAIPSQTFFRELYMRFGSADAWRVCEDVVPTLESLAQQGMQLGIISNWDERLRPLLRRLELSRYFQGTIISCEAGFAKPAPGIFALAAKRFGLPPARILHVGNSFDEDFQGAEAAGMQAVFLRRQQAVKGNHPMASLRDLKALLGS